MVLSLVRVKCELTDPLFEWNMIQLKTMALTVAILKRVLVRKTLESQISENHGLRITFLLMCRGLEFHFPSQIYYTAGM